MKEVKLNKVGKIIVATGIILAVSSACTKDDKKEETQTYGKTSSSIVKKSTTSSSKKAKKVEINQEHLNYVIANEAEYYLGAEVKRAIKKGKPMSNEEIAESRYYQKELAKKYYEDNPEKIEQAYEKYKAQQEKAGA